MTPVEIAVVVVSAWLAGWVALPVTIWRDDLGGPNARNWPGLILMRRGLPNPGAVWAQEFYEARRGWRWLPVALPLLVLGKLLPSLDWWRRSQEIMGHEIEVWAESALTGTEPHVIRKREAEALSRYREFGGWSEPDIDLAMRKVSHKAQDFVTRHMNDIQAKELGE